MPRFPSIKASPLLLAALCFFAAVAAYYPALDAKLVWDDALVQSEQVPLIRSPAEAFFPPSGIPQWAENYYRPVVVLTYWAEYQVNARYNGSPHNPAWAAFPHGVTLAVHALCAALVALLGWALFRGRAGRAWGALAAGVLFAVHPTHAESVVFISGRSDSLATLFLLAAFLSALRARAGRGTLWEPLSALFFLLALCSKEAALAGFAILLGLGLTEKAEAGHSKAPVFGRVAWLWLAAALAYFALRVVAGVSATGGEKLNLAGNGWNFLAALGFYVSESVYPIYLSPFIPFYPDAAATALALAALALCCWLAFRAYRRGEGLPAFFLLWFLAALGPPLALVFYNFSEAHVAERYLYLPGVAVVFAAGYALAGMSGRRFWVALFGVALCSAGFAFASWGAASRWGDSLTFWKDLTGNPAVAQHSLPWQNLADTLQLRGSFDEAERAYERALGAEIPIDSVGRAMCENGLGQIALLRAKEAHADGAALAAAEKLRKAQTHFARAVNTGYGDWRHARNLAETRLLLAETERGLTGRDEARLFDSIGKSLERAEALNPNSAQVAELRARYVNLVLTSPNNLAK